MQLDRRWQPKELQVDELAFGSGRKERPGPKPCGNTCFRKPLGARSTPRRIESCAHLVSSLLTLFRPQIFRSLAFSRSRRSAPGILMRQQGLNSKHLNGLFTDFHLHLSFDRCARWLPFGRFLPAKEKPSNPHRHRRGLQSAQRVRDRFSQSSKHSPDGWRYELMRSTKRV